MALRVLLSATVLEVSYFNNLASGSERKGLSAFTGKFPSSTAGLHLVLNTSCLWKKSCLVCYCMVECFHAITIGAKHLHFRCEQYCFPSRNKLFPRNPFKFLHIWESLVSQPRDSILETWDSILETWSSNISSIKARGSSFECQLTFERYCIKQKQAKQSKITEEYFSTLQFIVTTETVCEYFMTNLFTSKILKKLYPFRLPLGLRYEKRSNKI